MRYYSIFTEKGLLDLFNSNVIVDLPPQFVPPLEHEDILAMLRQLRSDIAKAAGMSHSSFLQHLIIKKPCCLPWSKQCLEASLIRLRNY